VAMTIISIKLNKIKIVDIINNIKGTLLLEAVLLLFKQSKESEFSIFIIFAFLACLKWVGPDTNLFIYSLIISSFLLKKGPSIKNLLEKGNIIKNDKNNRNYKLKTFYK